MQVQNAVTQEIASVTKAVTLERIVAIVISYPLTDEPNAG